DLAPKSRSPSFLSSRPSRQGCRWRPSNFDLTWNVALETCHLPPSAVTAVFARRPDLSGLAAGRMVRRVRGAADARQALHSREPRWRPGPMLVEPHAHLPNGTAETG